MEKGKCTDNIIKRSVLKPLSHRRPEVICGPLIGHSVGVATMDHGQVLVTKTITMEGDTAIIGKIIVDRGAGAMYIAGAEPAYLTVSVILPTDFKEPNLREMMKLMDNKCGNYHMEIIQGQTQVSGQVKSPIVTVTVTGFAKDYEKNQIESGDDIVMVGPAGFGGGAIIAQKKSQQLYDKYPSDFVDTAMNYIDQLSVKSAVTIGRKYHPSLIQEISEGGIFGALWALAAKSNKGFLVDLKKIIHKQHIIEMCNDFDINPYTLYGQGSLIICMPDASELVEELEESGIMAAVIGTMKDGHDKCIQNEDEIRYLDMPRGNQLLTL